MYRIGVSGTPFSLPVITPSSLFPFTVAIRSGARGNGGNLSSQSNPSLPSFPLFEKETAVPKPSHFSQQGFWTGFAILGIGAGVLSHFMPFLDDLHSGCVLFKPADGYRILRRTSFFKHTKDNQGKPNPTTLNLLLQNKETTKEYDLLVTLVQKAMGHTEVSKIAPLSSQEDLPHSADLLSCHIKMDKSSFAIYIVAIISAFIGGVIGGWGKGWLEKWQRRHHWYDMPPAEKTVKNKV